MSEKPDDPDSNTANDPDSDALELETVTRNEKWGPEAFHDAGEATFGELADDSDDE